MPFFPAAIDPRFAPSRIGIPLSGTLAPLACDWAIVIGADQLAPLSCDRITRRNTVVALPMVSNSEKKSTSVPSGSTTTWLLSVELLPPGA